MTEQEVWKPIPGWEQFYEVSDAGRVRTLDRLVPNRFGTLSLRKGKIMHPNATTPLRYPTYKLKRLGVVLNRTAHSLVALAFIGPRPDGKVVCHNDGNPQNNKLSNLRYDTQSENARDCYRYGSKVLNTHCTSGHEYTPENTYVRPSGSRECRICKRHQFLEFHRRRAEAAA